MKKKEYKIREKVLENGDKIWEVNTRWNVIEVDDIEWDRGSVYRRRQLKNGFLF